MNAPPPINAPPPMPPAPERFGKLLDRHAVNAGFALALVILTGIAALSYTSVKGFNERAQSVEHTQEGLRETEGILSDLKDVETGVRGYIISGQDSFLDVYREALAVIPDRMARMERLTADNSRQQQRIVTLRTLVDRRLDEAAMVLRLRQRTKSIIADDVRERVGAGKAVMDEIRVLTGDMRKEEEALLRIRSKESRRSALKTIAVIVAGNAAGFSILIIAFVLHTRKIALRDGMGTPRFLLGISEDITERKQAEERIQALNRDLAMRANQLEAANKELESFSYSVSHDLRAPLRAIDGFARIFEEDYRDKLDDEGRRLLQVIRDNSQKMGQLIDDLLSFSRLGRKPIAAARIDMRRAVENALAEVRSGAEATRTEIVIGNLGPAWGDGALLEQVWVNLLSNAIKYSSTRDHPKIEIGSLDTSAPEPSGITYFVRDNGAGFDMRYYDKLFGVFQRLHSTTEFPGTGVGLAIVHRLVTRHGGRVWAEAAVNEGATFYFSLPEGD